MIYLPIVSWCFRTIKQTNYTLQQKKKLSHSADHSGHRHLGVSSSDCPLKLYQTIYHKIVKLKRTTPGVQSQTKQSFVFWHRFKLLWTRQTPQKIELSYRGFLVPWIIWLKGKLQKHKSFLKSSIIVILSHPDKVTRGWLFEVANMVITAGSSKE